MKRLCLVAFVAVCFYSCDPGYYLAVVNNTEKSYQVSLKTRADSAVYFQSDPTDIFKEGEGLGKKVLLPSAPQIKNAHSSGTYSDYRYISTEIPSNQKVILASGIGGYRFPIIVNGDTIDNKCIKTRFRLWGVKQVLVIE